MKKNALVIASATTTLLSAANLLASQEAYDAGKANYPGGDNGCQYQAAGTALEACYSYCTTNWPSDIDCVTGCDNRYQFYQGTPSPYSECGGNYSNP